MVGGRGAPQGEREYIPILEESKWMPRPLRMTGGSATTKEGQEDIHLHKEDGRIGGRPTP